MKEIVVTKKDKYHYSETFILHSKADLTMITPYFAPSTEVLDAATENFFKTIKMTEFKYKSIGCILNLSIHFGEDYETPKLDAQQSHFGL